MQPTESLPHEIWYEIFDHSTYVPGLLDIPRSPQERLWTHLNSKNEAGLNTSLSTRTAIIQVSHSWRQIGMKLFCQYIRASPFNFSGNVTTSFTWFRRLVCLFEFGTKPTSSLTGYNPLWTMRIDCDAVFAGSKATSRLIELCSNLRIFRLTNYYSTTVLDPDRFIKLNRLFEEHSVNTLRQILYDEVDVDRAKEHNGSSLVANIPLESMSISIGSKFDTFYGDVVYEPPPSNVLHSLSSLWMSFPSEIPDSVNSWCFPSLRQLSIQTKSDYLRFMIPFVMAHRTTLVSIHLDCPNGVELLSEPSSFPNLDTITIHGDLFELLCNSDLTPWSFPTITHIGIIPSSNSEWLVSPLAITLALNSGRFMALEVIRILDRITSDVLMNEDGWTVVGQTCGTRKVRLENHCGELFPWCWESQ